MNIEERPIVIPKATMDRLLKTEKPSNAISLYLFYYYTAIWQKTNQPKATTAYASAGLQLSEPAIRTTKKMLIDLNLIEDVFKKDDKGKIAGHYIKVNYYSHPNDFLQYGEIKTVVKQEGNAYNTNNINAYNTNNKILNISDLKNSVPVEEKSIPKISANITDTNPEPIGNNIIAKGDKIPQEFIDFWKSYKGWKLGMKSAWELFKTHSDYRDCLGFLCSAVKSKIKSDQYLSSINQFTPQWKHLKNWLADRCWEEVPPLPPKGDTGYEPEFEAIQDLFGDYDQEG